ncbi:MAG: 4-hydroxythreonine-4-phosphate dehydrogenase PdxA [Sandaracinaceae bacterium]|nr:4-hydroxythreonine-4-phosphate dehydrogenase PdxA [Sandaracinaceae bacterium]
MSAPLLVPTGDPAGVGPLISLRAAREVGAPVRFFGDGARLAQLGATPDEVVDTGAVDDGTVAARAPSSLGGAAQLAALDAAIDLALAGEARALVTAPTCKEAIELSGTRFTGQTEHLARRAGLADDAVTMLFLGPRVRVSLVTTHLALRDVPDAITPARVDRAIRHLREALVALGLERPRVVVCGLNPHAGEGGLFGTEERDVIGPAARAAGVEGPIGAETALRLAAAGEVDGVVTMFHDQATIASKLVDWTQAVNVTWGLPFVRTSVDHGVAYDAAAAGTASEQGMVSAMRLALRLTERRP